MEIEDPFKITRRKLAQENAEKARTKPLDYIDKSVRIVNQWQNLTLEKNISHMEKSNRMFKQNVDREKRQFVSNTRKKMRHMIPGLNKRYGSNNSLTDDTDDEFDSELLRIVKFYENKNPKAIRHSGSYEELRHQRELKKLRKSKSVQLDPLDNSVSSSLQDISTDKLPAASPQQKNFHNHRKNHHPPPSRLEILDENSVSRAEDHADIYGLTEWEKEELRKRKHGVTSGPAFYLETGPRNFSRESPLKAHSSMAIGEKLYTDLSEDEEEITTAAAAHLLGFHPFAGSRVASRANNPHDTPTPALMSRHERAAAADIDSKLSVSYGGRESKLSMNPDGRESKLSFGGNQSKLSNENIDNDRTLNTAIRGFGTKNFKPPLSKVKSPQHKASMHIKGYVQSPKMDDAFNEAISKVSITMSDTEKSFLGKSKGFQRGKSTINDQPANNDTIEFHPEAATSTVSPHHTSLTINPLNSSIKRQRFVESKKQISKSPIGTPSSPKRLFYPMLSQAVYTSSKVLNNEDLSSVYSKSKNNSSSVQFTGKSPLPNISASGQYVPLDLTDDKKAENVNTSSKNNKSKNKSSKFFVPSDIKKICNDVSFDPYLLALNKNEIDEIETRRRVGEAEAKLSHQKKAFKHAEDSVQHWIKDVDDDIKKNKGKYISG